MSRMSQAQYYKQQQFNPTAFAIEQGAVFNDHFLKRMNLYTHKLQVPQGFWQGKHVLEVGCSSGENAIILASLGALFSFIDPLESSLQRLRRLFQQRDLSCAVKTCVASAIEDVSLSEQYDAIIAEGFLYTLPERKRIINSFLQALKPGGLLFISTLDPVGCFAEYFKKAVFIACCRQAEAATAHDQMEIAGQLFKDDYGSIPHSRPFESWVKDNFLNPTFDIHSLWGIKQILEDTIMSRPRVYSSWPRLVHALDMSWYKKIDPYETELQKVLDAYTRRVTCFFHGKTLADGSELPALKTGSRFERAVLQAMRAIQTIVERKSVDLKIMIPAIRLMQKNALACPDKKILSAILDDVLALARQPSAKRYKKARHVRACWGVGYPYYVLQRTSNKG